MRDATEMQAIIEIMVKAAMEEEAAWMRGVPSDLKEKWQPDQVTRLQMSGAIAALEIAGYTIVRKNS